MFTFLRAYSRTEFGESLDRKSWNKQSVLIRAVRIGNVRQAFLIAIVFLVTLTIGMASVSAFEIGDKVRAKRGSSWKTGTVIGFDEIRKKVIVKFDDDGTLDHLSEDVREKRLTRKFFPGALRAMGNGKRSSGTSNRSSRNNKPFTGSITFEESTVDPNTGSTSRRTVTITRGQVSSPSLSSPFSKSAAQSGKPQSRSWSDKSGRFDIQATYRGVNGTKVILEKRGRRRIEVELAKLSDADNEYVKAREAVKVNPFEVASVAAPPGSGPVEGEGDPTTGKTLVMNPQAAWSYTPPSPKPFATNGRKTKRIQLSKLPDSKQFFEEVVQSDISSDGTRALIVRKAGDIGHDDRHYMEDVDLDSGAILGGAALPAKRKILALSATHGLVVLGKDKHGGNETIEIARIKGGQFTQLAEFSAPVVRSGGRHSLDRSFWDIKKAWIVGPNHVMTKQFFSEMLTVWDFSNLTAVLHIPKQKGSIDQFVMSPDGELMAVPSSDGIAIVDLKNSKHVGTLSLPGEKLSGNNNGMLFNDTNTLFAIQSKNAVRVFNLSTGMLESELRHIRLASHGGLSWAGDFLLHRKKFLFDIEHHVLLWEFEGVSSFGSGLITRNGIACFVNKSHREETTFLQTFPVITQEITDMAKSLGSPESLIVAQAGDKVTIDLEIDPNVADEKNIFHSLYDNLEMVGLEVVNENAPLVLKAYCRQLERTKIRINTSPDRFHHGFRQQPKNIVTKTITPHPTSLSLTYKGIEIWRKGSSGTPGSTIWMEEGETLDQALRRLTTPNLSLLQESLVDLPLFRPGTATRNGAYGTTTIHD